MDARFYLKSLIDSSKQNSGEGNQVETDPIKIYLNELATKRIQNGTLYSDILMPIDSPSSILPKESYTGMLQMVQPNISSENKIGDENNYEFVIAEYPDDADFSSPENLIITFENSKFIFINEENLNYFLNKFIRVSAKQFMKSVLYSINFEKMNYLAGDSNYFGDLDVNAKNFEEKIAINNLKFVIQMGSSKDPTYIVIDDIDLEAFCVLNDRDIIGCIFDENEDKIMFNIEIDVYGIFNEYYNIGFVFSSDSHYETVITDINGTNYKEVREVQEN